MPRPRWTALSRPSTRRLSALAVGVAAGAAVLVVLAQPAAASHGGGSGGGSGGSSTTSTPRTSAPVSQPPSPITTLTPTPTTSTPATITCAPDAFEIDDAGTGPVAPIAVGGTASRAICQGRNPLPGKTEARDVDYFEFTAVEGQAYTVEAVSVGAGLVNEADRGGLSVGFSQIGTDGLPAGIVQSTAPNGDRSTTLALHAGRYLIGVADADQQVYPADNVLATKTIQGSDGLYTIKLTATAPAPVLKSITVSPGTVQSGKQATATMTFTAPLLSGGSYLPVMSSDGFVAAPGGTQVAPGGVTSWTVPIDARTVSRDTTVTISSQVSGVGPTLSTPLTVRK